MKSMKLINIAASLLVVITAFVLNPIGVSAEWKQSSNGLWWYAEDSGWTTGWRQIDGKWYYFDKDGYMKTGWIKDNIEWYYLNKDGALVQKPYYSRVDLQWIPTSPEILSDTTLTETNLEKYSMSTEENVYNLGTKEIKVYIINNTNGDGGYGTNYEIDRFENNQWHKLDFKNNVTFESIFILMEPKGTNEETYKLNSLKDFNNLIAGRYRIVKEIDDSNISAEFELK